LCDQTEGGEAVTSARFMEFIAQHTAEGGEGRLRGYETRLAKMWRPGVHRHDTALALAPWMAREAAADRVSAAAAFGVLDNWWLAVADQGDRHLGTAELLSIKRWAIGQADAEPERIEAMRTKAQGSPAPDDTDTTDDGLPAPVDWHALYAHEGHELEWLVEDLWPAGRLISIVAPIKARKSLLMLYLAACLARGMDPWTGRPTAPVDVTYLDYEMVEEDLLDRVEAMGLVPEELGRLHYYLHPQLPNLDTRDGGQLVGQLVQRDRSAAVLIDTFARVLSDDEDKAGTINDFDRHTATQLKRARVGVARLDHTGHQDQRRARGSSGKGADVDIAWVLRRTDEGITLDHHGVTRIGSVPQVLNLAMIEEPLRFVPVTSRAYPEGTKEVAELLDKLGVPIDASSRQAAKLLKVAGEGRRRELVVAAQRWRREELPAFGNHPAGKT
jgi:hypothetical protein